MGAIVPNTSMIRIFIYKSSLNVLGYPTFLLAPNNMQGHFLKSVNPSITVLVDEVVNLRTTTFYWDEDD